MTRTRIEPRDRLTRERVLATALAYVDAHGLAALSMHKLGAELGVKGMSLYRHVDGKEALLDGLTEAMWAEVDGPGDEMAWQHALRHCARSIRGVVLRHPAAAPLLIARRTMPRHALEMVDAYLVMIRRDFAAERATEVLRTVTSYALGFALTEVCWPASGEPVAEADEELRRLREVTAMVPQDTPDHLFRLALDFCGGCDMDVQFELGLDLMVRGLETPAATGDDQLSDDC